MTPFSRLSGIAAAIPLANIDTDKILPARFLKTISRDGLGRGLFADMRREPGFILDRAPWSRAEILVALDNFGCGSSREHAPWALLDFGIRCVIAPSFADIFYNNCFKNGILPVTLPSATIAGLIDLIVDPATATIDVDLPGQIVRDGHGAGHRFEIDPSRKNGLIAGLDEIDETLRREADIAQFEANRPDESWLPDIVVARFARR